MEIDNEVAIEILKTFREAMDTPITNYRDILLGSLDMAIKALENDRPQGEWISEDLAEFPRKYTCSACGDWQTYGRLKFCPNCGAKMGGAGCKTP